MLFKLAFLAVSFADKVNTKGYPSNSWSMFQNEPPPPTLDRYKCLIDTFFKVGFHLISTDNICAQGPQQKIEHQKNKKVNNIKIKYT